VGLRLWLLIEGFCSREICLLCIGGRGLNSFPELTETQRNRSSNGPEIVTHGRHFTAGMHRQRAVINLAFGFRHARQLQQMLRPGAKSISVRKVPGYSRFSSMLKRKAPFREKMSLTCSANSRNFSRTSYAPRSVFPEPNPAAGRGRTQ
jgi:hypothetical protein